MIQNSEGRESYIARAKAKHGEKYDYSRLIYKNSKAKVEIICSSHGSFMQNPGDHLRGKGCPSCSGNKKMDTGLFVAKAREKYGSKFAFDKTCYKNARTKLIVTCSEHGDIEVAPDVFLNRSKTGCNKCGNAITADKKTKYNTEKIVEAYREKWGDEYDYSEVVYKGYQEKVRITHLKCGRTFEQLASSHLKYGCMACSAKQRGLQMKAKSKARFLERARSIHGDAYEYHLDEFESMTSHIKIHCRKHDYFFRSAPNNHLHPKNPTGCPKCALERISKFHSSGLDNFVLNARAIHGDVYDYSEVEYTNNRTKVAIKCKEHGVFMQTPGSHLAKSGCPMCSSSRMERYIASYLESVGIEFSTQHTFHDCKRKMPLPFDFAVKKPDGTVAGIIEYHGDQHFRPVEHFGGEVAFRDRTINDYIKSSYCHKNGIPILVAKSSDDDQIELVVMRFCKDIGVA